MKLMHASHLGAECSAMKWGLYLQVSYKHLRTGINQRNLSTVVDNGKKTFPLQLPLKCQGLLSPAKLSHGSEVRYGDEGLTSDFRLPCFEFLCSDNAALCCCPASVECWKRKWKGALTSTENLTTDGKGKSYRRASRAWNVCPVSDTQID